MSKINIPELIFIIQAGFPVHGGLYDARLGPSEEFAHCDTCGLSYAHCPGHYGHIALTVPVFNPLLFSFTFNVRFYLKIYFYSKFLVDEGHMYTLPSLHF